jgi:hypothetical protein
MMKRYGHTAFAIVIGVAMAALLSCSKLNPVAPQITSHEFEWEIDTINTGNCQFVSQTLWGTSDSNMYLGGYTCDECSLWRWNGKKWTGYSWYNNDLPHDIEMIDGIDSTFFALVGNTATRAKVVVCDHGKFRNITGPLILKPWFTAIEVVSRNEIYIGGVDGILKYNGSDWEWMLDSTDSKFINGFYQFWPISIVKTWDGNVYFTSHKYDEIEPHTMYFWKWMGTQFVLVDSYILEGPRSDVRFGTMLYEMEKSLFSANYGFFKLNGISWQKLTPYLGRYITGSNCNIFVAWDSLYHYNGGTWMDILPRERISLRPTLMSDIRYSDGTIFAAMYMQPPTIVLRGRQKKVW